MSFCLFAVLAALAGPTREEATDALTRVGARSPPVGYLFWLDTSAAMEVSSEALRPEIARLVEAAPAGDSVEVIAFHIRPYVALPRTPITEASRASLAAKIRALDLSSGFDRDLGDSLHLLATELSEPSAPAFTHVFGVSNFCHVPTVLSPWSSGGRGCGAIRNQASIGTTVAAVRDAGRLEVRWFPVDALAARVDSAGLAAARHEFGGDAIMEPPLTWLQNFTARLTSERARPAALADARDAGFTVRAVGVPSATGEVELEFTSTSRVLDLKLQNLTAVGLAEPPPGALDLTRRVRVKARLKVPRPPWSVFPRQDDIDVVLSFSGDGMLEPRAALHLWSIKEDRPGLTATTTVSVHRAFGLSLPAGIALLALVFATTGMAAVVIRGRLMPLRLGGALTARFRGGARQVIAIAGLSEAAVVLDENGHARLGKRDVAAVVIRVRRPVWNLHGEAHIRAPDTEINGRKVAPGVHRVVPGASSFRIGEWRLTWE